VNLRDRLEHYDNMSAARAKEDDLQTKLIEFHQAMGVPVLESPQVPPDDRIRLRCRLIVEEALELLDACFDNGTNEALDCARKDLKDFIDSAPVSPKLSLIADALADVAYVVEGANLEFGIDSGPVLEEVHRANMAKVNGPRRADGKVMKPEGWTPPDIVGVLERQRK
jgi:predicted HAD superfamily Cof-like phosphohydrolase